MEIEEARELILKIVEIANNWNYPFCEEEIKKVTGNVNAYYVERYKHFVYTINKACFALQGDNIILVFPIEDLDKFLDYTNREKDVFYDECLGFEVRIDDMMVVNYVLDELTDNLD